MTERAVRPFAFWQELDKNVTAKVQRVLGESEGAREPVVIYLRELEEMARKACSRRETIQILVSGRRLLGDTSTVGTADGPFAHTLGLEG